MKAVSMLVPITVTLVTLGLAGFHPSEQCPFPPVPVESSRVLRSGAARADAMSGRRLRGDWEPPDTLFLAVRDDWVEPLGVIMLAAVTDTELVLMSDREGLPAALESLIPDERRQAVVMFSSMYDSPWVRDYGPLQIEVDGRPVWLDFAYRGERWLDDGIPALLAQHLDIELERYDVVLEGGALIGNGRGLCAMTEESLAEAGVSPEEHEAVDWLLDRLGCRSLALLPRLPGELTGHADMLAQFLAPDLVAVAEIDQAASALQAATLDQIVEVLRAAARSLGQPLEVLRLPMLVEDETFYSYVNGTRLKSYYLVPSYEHVPADIEEEVYRRLDAALPHLELVPVPSDIMINLGGAVHCMTVGLRLKRS